MTFHRSLRGALALGCALSFASLAAAEPVQVEYFVAQKAFKKNVDVDSVLDFALYEDEACTVEIGRFPIFASDPYALFFIDKHQKLKQAKRRKKAVRIRATIDVPSTAASPYLRVSGPGIEPVGEECQLQAGLQGSASAPQGAQGEQGPAGPAGADGAQGPAGPAGADGAEGPAGPAGADGAEGPAGADGAQGPAGADGAQGPAGADGAQGPAGPAGADGAQGPAGPAGADGAQGPAGPAGADGAQGPAGPAGADGAQGPAGPAGADGAQGPAGADGTSGSLLGGNYPNTSDGNFLSPFNPSVGNEDSTSLPVSSGTARKLIVSFASPLGGGESVTLTVRQNGVDTALTCTVSAGESSCFNSTQQVAFADGDLLSIRYNEAGNPNARPRFTILYQAP